MPDVSPLIVTVALDAVSFTFFDALRKQYFPQHINFIAAHLTLFHHLPPDQPSVIEDIISVAESQPILSLQVVDVVSIGKGVAYKIVCPHLSQLHKNFQERWLHWLTPQDKQKLWPHVTIQNKVAPSAAKETLKELKTSFTPFTAYGLGLSLWTYEGGPWKFTRQFPFQQ